MAKRVDANQADIVSALRQFGASVKDVHTVKNAFDILVGYHGKDYKFEVKSIGGRLTPGEKAWHDGWHGAPTYIIHTFEEAIAIICDM